MPAIKFRLDHPKKDKPASILVQLYVSQQIRPEIATGEKVIKDNWDQPKMRVKTKAPHAIEINKHLHKIEGQLMELWRDNKEDDAKALKAKMLRIVQGRKNGEKKTLFEALTLFIEQYLQEKDKKTAGRYKVLENKLLAFSELYDFDLETMDYKFYDRFKAWMYTNPNPVYGGYTLEYDRQLDIYNLVKGDKGLPVPLFDDVVYKYISQLKTFCKWAVKRGYKVNQSYQQWEMIAREHEVIALTMAELEKLENTLLPSKALDAARDYLVMECRTGQRISDIKRFDPKDLGDMKWTFRPKKGNRLNSKTVTVHFTGYCRNAYDILVKYNFKLPAISEQKINKNIKKACEAAGIDSEITIYRWSGNKKVAISGKKYEYLSTHTGRRTFITIGLQFLAPEVVMELTGIGNYKTLRRYKGAADTKVIEGQLNKIESNMRVMRKAN